mmetsp:Transcript_132302/g.197114  ORF Transcript_132302/g.197114 Transcript_132302/m.197114 type:complete len:142 (+) Transcript_132302:677-1102(+)
MTQKNKLIAEVKINPEVGGWFSWKKKLPTDYLGGDIFKYTGSDSSKDRTSVSKVSGSWMGCVLFDNKRMWSIKDKIPTFELIPADDPLPSDSRFREDVSYLKAGDIEPATEWKAKLEDLQRSEAKIRKAYCQKNELNYVPV